MHNYYCSAPYFPGGNNNLSGEYDDATDVEDSDEPEVEEDLYVDRDKYDNWIPPIYLKAQSILIFSLHFHLDCIMLIIS